MLKQLGYTGRDQIALFPPVLLDPISTDVLLSQDPQTGNDLLAHYNTALTLVHRPLFDAIGASVRMRHTECSIR